MIFNAKIGMLIAGLFVLVTGKLRLGKQQTVEGSPARLLGLVFMAPLPLNFYVGLAIGAYLEETKQVDRIRDLLWPLLFIDIAIISVCFAIIYGVGSCYVKPQPTDLAPRKQDRVENDSTALLTDDFPSSPFSEFERDAISELPMRTSSLPPKRRADQPPPDVRVPSGRGLWITAVVAVCVAIFSLVVTGLVSWRLFNVQKQQAGQIVQAPPQFPPPGEKEKKGPQAKDPFQRVASTTVAFDKAGTFEHRNEIVENRGEMIGGRDAWCRIYDCPMRVGQKFRCEANWIANNHPHPPQLLLTDMNGKILAVGDQGFLSDYRPPHSSPVRLIVTTVGNRTGTFELKIKASLISENLVTLDRQGRFQAADSIGPTNEQGVVGNQDFLGKVYTVDLAAGQTYGINVDSSVFPTRLIVVDSSGQLIKEAHGDIRVHSCRLDLLVTQDARYRIYVTSWSGRNPGAFTFAIRKFTGKIEHRVPDRKAVAAANVELPVPIAHAIDGAVSRQLLGQQTLPILDGVVWSKDGRSITVLYSGGSLRRLNVATGEVEDQAELRVDCGNLARSGEGLLISATRAKEIWVINPANLSQILSKIHVPRIERVSAGWESHMALATPNDGNAEDHNLQLIDLKSGVVQNRYRIAPYRSLTVTPDGKFAFGLDVTRHVQRLRIESNGIFSEASMPALPLGYPRIVVSGDSERVAIAGQDERLRREDFPKLGGLGSFVFAVENLDRPIVGLASGPTPRAVGFDPVSGYIFAQSTDKSLILFSYDGERRFEYSFPNVYGGQIDEISVSPAGFEAVLRSSGRIDCVTLQKSQK